MTRRGGDPHSESARARMIERQVRARGVRDSRTLAALREVPRHLFLPPDGRHLAYRDLASPIGEGQTISQPYMVALMTEALQVRPGDRVLEIGTGSGYQTAVLAEIVGPRGEICTVERHPRLSLHARDLLEELGYHNVRFRIGDGTRGWPEQAPFDRIIVTAAGPRVPPALRAQLREDGGRLVIPVGARREQELWAFTRWGTELVRESLGVVQFVPLVGEQGWVEER